MPGGPRESLDPDTLPAAARWVLAAETTLRDAGLPPLLRRGDDPSTPSVSLLIAVMLGVGAATAFVLAGVRESPGLGIAFAPVAVALWAGTIVGLEPGRLARVRLGPWLPAAGSWLAVVGVLEVLSVGLGAAARRRHRPPDGPRRGLRPRGVGQGPARHGDVGTRRTGRPRVP